MSKKHDFHFSAREIEQKVEELYQYEEHVMLANEPDEPPAPYELSERGQDLKFYFECLADSLWKAGAFRSQEEARARVKADTEILQRVSGPEGLRPDDGQLNPDELAEGLVALKSPNEFLFQAPICWIAYPHVVDVEIKLDVGRYRLTSNFEDLDLVKFHSDLSPSSGRGSGEFLWIQGSTRSQLYEVAKRQVDLLVTSVMGIMEVLELVKYTPYAFIGLRSPQLTIGTKKRFNSGQYLDMHSPRLCEHLQGLHLPPADNELDATRSPRSRLDRAFRFVARALADQSASALAVQHACRTFLRSYESWNVGESAMFYAVTLEGLLLDKRQKDDLSVRLQDSAAYWLGGSSAEREQVRKTISELYKIRSNYVHNGADAPPTFDLAAVRELTRRVVRKELLTLGPVLR